MSMEKTGDDSIKFEGITSSHPDYATGETTVVPTPPKLEKRFNVLSTIGMNFSMTSTPLAIGTYLSVVIGVGGSPVFVYGYVVAVFLNLLVCASLAEIAAALPHSSGQIYWTAVLAPKSASRPLSYIVGWFACAAYFFWTAASALLASQLIWALVCVCQNTFVVQQWHYYIVYVVITLFALLLNWPLIRTYPYVLNGLIYYLNAGAIFILIALLVKTHPKQSAGFVFTDFVNSTGWKSDAVVFMLGLLPGAVAVNAFDAAAHLTDELPNPSRQVPQVMMASAVLSAITGFPMVLVYMYCNTKPDNLAAPIGGQPIAQLLYDSFDSTALTIIGILIFIVAMVAATVTLLTTFSRVWWALAREGGVPFSKWMGEISEKKSLPVNSLVFAVLAVIIIGLLELGSSTAINAVLGTSVVCIYVSYAIPILCLLFNRDQKLTGQRYFDLGKMGLFLNVVAVLWMAFEFVWLMFPDYVPITASTFNYSVAVFSGVAIVSTVNWVFYSRKAYSSPVEMVEF